MASNTNPDSSQSNIASHINESFNATLEMSTCPPFASTPFKVPTARARGKKGGKPMVYVRPVCDTCNVCGKEYRCHRSFLNHMRQHSIKDAASRYPRTSQIIQHCSETVFESVKLLMCKPAAGQSGVKYREFLHFIDTHKESISALPQWKECFQIIHERITTDLSEHKILMPSALLSVLVRNNEDILGDVDLRKKLCELLAVCVVSESNVLHCFIADFTSMLITTIFKYYSNCVKKEVQQSVPANVQLDTDDLEAIHYISGCVVRSFYKKSLMFPKNVGWANIGKLISEKLLESDSVPGPSKTVKQWTAARSKGKLFFVSGRLFDFFVGVTCILYEPQQNKLRIDSSLVIESVCQGSVVLLWDEVVGDSLNEKASYEVMCGMIRSFCTTFAVGRSKELLNKMRKNKGEASLALRARVAPRSST